MNKKITDYVDSLFSDVPGTKTARELRQEILADLSDHFEAHIAEGKSENQAFTEALGDMGDIDALLSTLAPERELKVRIDEYRKKKAQATSLAVMLYIGGVTLLCALPAVSAVFSVWNPAKAGITGFILMLVCVAIATGLLVYTKMSTPQDIKPFLTRASRTEFDTDTPGGRFLAALSKPYWLIVTAVYLLISFLTGAWHITWLVWLIANALWQAITLWSSAKEDEA